MEAGDRYEFVVSGDSGPPRLDAWLAGQPALSQTGLSRSRLQALAADGLITVNDQPARSAQRVRPGDAIVVSVPPVVAPADLVPQDIPLAVVYEDSHVAVVDKPAGPGGASWTRPSRRNAGQRAAGPLPGYSRHRR